MIRNFSERINTIKSNFTYIDSETRKRRRGTPVEEREDRDKELAKLKELEKGSKRLYDLKKELNEKKYQQKKN